ncbi:MAG: hypothetical protein PHF64_04855 [Methanoregula sp.]|jgi:hypothetical protein|nr:hypothetical protein [Methanoregula sp.]MDD5023735.1 hypothetical protein [Methanoregula sp.]
MRRIHRIGQALYEKKLAIASGKRRAAKQYRFENLALATEISDMYWEKHGTCSDSVLREILDFGVLGEDYPFAVRSPKQCSSRVCHKRSWIQNIHSRNERKQGQVVSDLMMQTPPSFYGL